MWNPKKVVTKQEDVIGLVGTYIPMFQGCKLDKNSLATYSKLLMDLPLENISVAFEMLTTQTKFFPTVAEIREIAERLSWDIEYRETHMGK
jgi:hypothetical protein